MTKKTKAPAAETETAQDAAETACPCPAPDVTADPAEADPEQSGGRGEDVEGKPEDPPFEVADTSDTSNVDPALTQAAGENGFEVVGESAAGAAASAEFAAGFEKGPEPATTEQASTATAETPPDTAAATEDRVEGEQLSYSLPEWASSIPIGCPVVYISDGVPHAATVVSRCEVPGYVDLYVLPPRGAPPFAKCDVGYSAAGDGWRELVQG